MWGMRQVKTGLRRGGASEHNGMLHVGCLLVMHSEPDGGLPV